MTAAHRRHLELVDDTTGTDQLTEATDGDAVEPINQQWNAEDQFIGALLWLRREHALHLLDLVPNSAIWQPVARWAYELIQHVITEDSDPTPVAVLAAGRHRSAHDAVDAGQPPSARQHHQLALYLFDAYAQVLAPHAAADTYAREVLDAAYRRAFDICGIRMQELAASGADRADLTDQFGAIRDELADLWRRAEAAAPQSERNRG
jgi:replicative DNA helicase